MHATRRGRRQDRGRESRRRTADRSSGRALLTLPRTTTTTAAVVPASPASSAHLRRGRGPNRLRHRAVAVDLGFGFDQVVGQRLAVEEQSTGPRCSSARSGRTCGTSPAPRATRRTTSPPAAGSAGSVAAPGVGPAGGSSRVGHSTTRPVSWCSSTLCRSSRYTNEGNRPAPGLSRTLEGSGNSGVIS